MPRHGFGVERFEATREDVAYLRHGAAEFLARVWRPTSPGEGRVCVVDVHGGAWCDNDRRFGKRYDSMLAAHGAVVVAIDFRCGASGPHPAGSTDVQSAVRWARANAGELGVDPSLVVSVGSSSGGHLAWLAALNPSTFTPADRGEIRVGEVWVPADSDVGFDATVLGVGAFWPPVDPWARYRYASKLDTDHGRRLVSNTEAYFGTEKRMREASIARIVADGEATQLPPVLLVVPENDRNVPPAITDAAASGYAAAGGRVQVEHYPGVGHGFGHIDADQSDHPEEIRRFDRDLVAWIRHLADAHPSQISSPEPP